MGPVGFVFFIFFVFGFFFVFFTFRFFLGFEFFTFERVGDRCLEGEGAASACRTKSRAASSEIARSDQARVASLVNGREGSEVRLFG